MNRHHVGVLIVCGALFFAGYLLAQVLGWELATAIMILAWWIK